MEKRGLVLQGGGTRGAYQAGAYMAFRKCHLKINAACGTSIGAINSLFIACHKEKELLHFWQSINVGQILNFLPEYLEDKEKHEFIFRHFLKNYWKVIKNKGIETKGLVDFLKKHISYEELQKSKIDYGLLTVKVNRFHFTPMYIFKDNIPKSQLYDYVLASAYLPIFKMEKKIDNHFYLDGGFYDNTPINMLIDKGYRKIYVIELNPLLNINRKLKSQAQIIKITPRRSLGGVLTFNNNKLREYIQMGYYDALKVLKKLDGLDYCFPKKSNIYYKYVLRQISPSNLNYLKSFFHAKTEKDLVIKSLEYFMKKNNYSYYAIYKQNKILKHLKKYSPVTKIDEIIRQIKFL